MYELRLRDTYLNEEKAKALLNDIENNPGCCDAVWINNLYGYPRLETIKAAIEKMKVIKLLFEEKGFPVSLQISNTIGHGNNYIKLYDYSGLVFEGSQTEGFTDYKGNVAEACFCPYNKAFLDYIYESTKLYAELKPECVWIDDDMRMYNHLPASYGCFCDSCIDRFNKKYGTRFTRKELVHEMDYGDINVRKAYIEQCRNALATLTSVIADALLEVSPDSKLAYQSARFNHYLGTDFDCVFDAMHEKTGKPVYYRPGGAFYDDNAPADMLIKALQMDSANAFLPDYVEGSYAEIENTPNVVFGKSFEGTAIEGTLYLEYGCNGLTFATMNTFEANDYDKRMLSRFSKYRPYWDEIVKHNKNTQNSGVGIYTSPDAHLAPLNKSDSSFKWTNAEYMSFKNNLASMGIPLTNRFENTPVIVLYPETVFTLTEKDIEYLLERPVITDAQAFEMLCKKGYGDAFGACVHPLAAESAREYFTKHPVNSGFENKFWKASMFTGNGIIGAYEICDKDGSTEPLAEYVDIFTGENLGCVDAIVKTFPKSGKSAKWAVIGYSLWETIVSSFKRNQIMNACDYICGHTLPALLTTAEKCLVIPHTDLYRKTVSVSLQSLSIGHTDTLSLTIRNPASENFRIMGVYRPMADIPYEKNGDSYILKIDALSPYENITVFCS